MDIIVLISKLFSVYIILRLFSYEIFLNDTNIQKSLASLVISTHSTVGTLKTKYDSQSA